MSGDASEDLGGGVDLALLAETTKQVLTALPTGDSTEASAILKPLSTFLSRCVARFASVDDCAFVFSSEPEDDFALLPKGKAHSQLTSQKGSYSPSGRLHMVAAGGSRARSTPAQVKETALAAMLSSLGLSERPIAVFRSEDESLTWFPRGIGRPNLAIDFPVETPVVSLKSVERALAIFHSKRCQVPDRTISFWHDAPKRVPKKLAEKEIQKSLLQSLETLFHNCRVEREPKLKSSEVDFVIFGQHGALQAALCVIEVKVLREKRFAVDAKLAKRCPPAANRKSLIDGVEQAAFARDEVMAPLALMTAFDMRAEDDPGIMQAVAATSKTLSVECRRYFMFNSKTAFRKGTV